VWADKFAHHAGAPAQGENTVGGPLPTRIVGVCQIGPSPFQRRLAKCASRATQLKNKIGSVGIGPSRKRRHSEGGAERFDSWARRKKGPPLYKGGVIVPLPQTIRIARASDNTCGVLASLVNAIETLGALLPRWSGWAGTVK
jgi:hypothetical protein